MSKRLDAIFEEALERLRRGESMAACLAAYPEDAATLRPLLEAARQTLSMPPPPEPGRVAEGWSKLRAGLEAERQRAQQEQSHRGGPFLAALALPSLALGRLGSPVLRGASLLALAALLGVTGLAAAAAVGQGGVFSPVTDLFGGGGPSAPSSSANDVEFEGEVTAISGLTLTVEVTELEGAGLIGCTDVEVDITFGEVEGPLGIGNAVKVEGQVTGECQVRADEVKTLMVAPIPTPTSTAGLGGTPTSTPTAMAATPTATSTPTGASPTPTSTPVPATSEVEFEGHITAINDLTLTVDVLEVEEGNLIGCATVTVDLSTAEEIEGPLTVGSAVEVEGLRTDGCNVQAEKVEAEQPADDGDEAADDDDLDDEDEEDGDLEDEDEPDDDLEDEDDPDDEDDVNHEEEEEDEEES